MNACEKHEQVKCPENLEIQNIEFLIIPIKRFDKDEVKENNQGNVFKLITDLEKAGIDVSNSDFRHRTLYVDIRVDDFDKVRQFFIQNPKMYDDNVMYISNEYMNKNK